MLEQWAGLSPSAGATSGSAAIQAAVAAQQEAREARQQLQDLKTTQDGFSQQGVSQEFDASNRG